jgi:hypothetical protein
MDRSNAFPVSGEDGISPPKPLLIGRLGAERILNRKSFESKFGHLSNTNQGNAKAVQDKCIRRSKHSQHGETEQNLASVLSMSKVSAVMLNHHQCQTL